MKLNRIALIAGTVFCSSAVFAQGWYNGDFDQRNGGNVSGFNGFDSRIYDDFNVGGGGWTVTGVFMNVLTNIPTTDILTFSWEIRQGVSAGNGGTVVASNTTGVSVTATGRSGFGLTEYMVLASGLNVNLAAGTYWLGGKIGGNGTSNTIYVSTTSGANAIGTPPGNNDMSYWDSTSFGIGPFAPTSTVFGAGQAWDLSMGVRAVPIPEPGTFVALGVGLAALAALRRRK